MSDRGELLEEIYEAAVVAEHWPNVLERMSGIVGSVGALLFSANKSGIRWTASSSIQERMSEFVREGWAQRNPRMGPMSARNHAGFLRDSDCLSAEEMDADLVYRDFWRKRGLGYCVGTELTAPSGDSVIFSFERAHDLGPVPNAAVEMLDSFRPHLARAGLLAARLGLERARAMASVLASLGLPGAVLHGNGKLQATNHLFEALMPQVAQDRRDRLRLADRGADGLLADALGRAAIGDGMSVNSIPVAATEMRPPYVLHLLPVCGAAHDVFGLAASLLVVTPVDRAAVPNAEVLQGLFDLSPAEARVARSIAAAQTIGAVAGATGVSRETVRTQLRAVMVKTGVSRQAELVSLLAGRALRQDQD